MDCNSCDDNLKCEFYMKDYPGSGDLWRAKKLCEEKEKKMLLDHILEVSLLLKTMNITDEKYQELITNQAKLALWLKK